MGTIEIQNALNRYFTDRFVMLYSDYRLSDLSYHEFKIGRHHSFIKVDESVKKFYLNLSLDYVIKGTKLEDKVNLINPSKFKQMMLDLVTKALDVNEKEIKIEGKLNGNVLVYISFPKTSYLNSQVVGAYIVFKGNALKKLRTMVKRGITKINIYPLQDEIEEKIKKLASKYTKTPVILNVGIEKKVDFRRKWGHQEGYEPSFYFTTYIVNDSRYGKIARSITGSLKRLLEKKGFDNISTQVEGDWTAIKKIKGIEYKGAKVGIKRFNNKAIKDAYHLMDTLYS